jgi:hypothetical protein
MASFVLSEESLNNGPYLGDIGAVNLSGFGKLVLSSIYFVDL